jgi:P-type Ca2+ transporter type 2C
MMSTPFEAELTESPTAADVTRRLGSDLMSGLEPAEAARRRQAHGPNQLPSEPPTPWWRLLARQFIEPMAILLVIAAAVAGFALGERLDAIAILAIVALNALIGVSEEERATHALEALKTMETSTAKVVRGGAMRIVPTTDVVPGDLISLSAGDRVPADLRLTDTNTLQADESILTGESLPVEKDALAAPAHDAAIGDRRWMAFSGTHVVGGSARGVVVTTGAETVIGHIARELAAVESATPLQRELRGLTARLGVIAVAVAGGVFCLILLRTGLSSGSVEEAFLASVALAVAGWPIGASSSAGFRRSRRWERRRSS